MTLVSTPFVHSCCEHQPVASQLNEQNALLATALFSKAQAPGGSFIVFAEATEKLAGSATMPANNATFTMDITLILVPRFDFSFNFAAPAPYEVTFYIVTAPRQAVGATFRFVPAYTFAVSASRTMPSGASTWRVYRFSTASAAALRSLAPDAERFLRRTIGDREQHRLLRRVVGVALPRRHDEDVVLGPFEHLAVDGRRALALDADKDGAVGGAIR